MLNMKSVMVFDPKDSDEQTATQYMDWRRDNGMSAVGDKAVPNAEQTRIYLSKRERLA